MEACAVHVIANEVYLITLCSSDSPSAALLPLRSAPFSPGQTYLLGNGE